MHLYTMQIFSSRLAPAFPLLPMAYTRCYNWANIKSVIGGVCLNFVSYAPRLKIEKKFENYQKTLGVVMLHNIGCCNAE